MHWLNHVYAKSFNRRHNRRDHLFGKRFWDKLIVTDEQLVATTRYVAINPVKAGLCKRPEDSPWSTPEWEHGRRAIATNLRTFYA
jgi:putative transposase